MWCELHKIMNCNIGRCRFRTTQSDRTEPQQANEIAIIDLYTNDFVPVECFTEGVASY